MFMPINCSGLRNQFVKEHQCPVISHIRKLVNTIEMAAQNGARIGYTGGEVVTCPFQAILFLIQTFEIIGVTLVTHITI